MCVDGVTDGVHTGAPLVLAEKLVGVDLIHRVLLQTFAGVRSLCIFIVDVVARLLGRAVGVDFLGIVGVIGVTRLHIERKPVGDCRGRDADVEGVRADFLILGNIPGTDAVEQAGAGDECSLTVVVLIGSRGHNVARLTDVRVPGRIVLVECTVCLDEVLTVHTVLVVRHTGRAVEVGLFKFLIRIADIGAEVARIDSACPIPVAAVVGSDRRAVLAFIEGLGVGLIDIGSIVGVQPGVDVEVGTFRAAGDVLELLAAVDVVVARRGVDAAFAALPLRVGCIVLLDLHKTGIGILLAPCKGVKHIGACPAERAVLRPGQDDVPGARIVCRALVVCVERILADRKRLAGEAGDDDRVAVSARKGLNADRHGIAREERIVIRFVLIVVEGLVRNRHADNDEGSFVARFEGDLLPGVGIGVLAVCRIGDRAGGRAGVRDRAIRDQRAARPESRSDVARIRRLERGVRCLHLVGEVVLVVAEREVGVVLGKTVEARLLARCRVDKVRPVKLNAGSILTVTTRTRRCIECKRLGPDALELLNERRVCFDIACDIKDVSRSGIGDDILGRQIDDVGIVAGTDLRLKRFEILS